MSTPPFLTIGDLARRFGLPTWKVRRLWERGILSPASRVGLYRIVSAADLPQIEEALKEAGYLPTEETISA